jgi:hypothetical protein
MIDPDELLVTAECYADVALKAQLPMRDAIVLAYLQGTLNATQLVKSHIQACAAINTMKKD